MNLDEAREVFPHGSRWSDGNTTRTVVGWEEIGGYCRLVTAAPQGTLARWRADQALTIWARIPDAPPCPITQPTTLRTDGAYWLCAGPPILNGPHTITLHPPGTQHTAFADGEWGIYTWGDQ